MTTNVLSTKIVLGQFLSQHEYVVRAAGDVTRLVIATRPLYTIVILSGNS
jgi:hypothetical protein